MTRKSSLRLPDLPQSWINAWRSAYLESARTSPLLGGGGSILSPVAPAPSVDQRTLQFGPYWQWWGLSDEQRQAWWEMG